MISRLDVSRWNGSVRLRFQSFAQHVRTVPLAGQVDDLAGTVELCVDPSGRVVGVHWPDERDAPAAVRPTARLDPVRNVAVVWLTDAAEEASASRHVVQPAGTALVYPLAVHTGADGRAVGFEFFAPRSALPESFVDELSAGSPEEEADTGDSTVDHRVATDAVGEETFAFHAGPLVWRTFAADLADYARVRGLELSWSRTRGPLWGLLDNRLDVVVRGPFSEITRFAEYARLRVVVWRDGNVAG